MHPHALFASMLAAIVAAPIAAGFQSSLGFEHANTIPWPTSLPSPGTFTRTVRGEFTGDGAWDAFVLAGNQPVFLYAPSVHSTVVLPSISANDVDTAIGAGLEGRDALAYVNSTGLSLCRYEPTSGTFGSVLVADSLPWPGALRVRSADLNGSGIADFVGVGAANPRTVVVRRDLAGGGTSQLTFLAYQPVLDLAAVQWDLDAPLELVLLTEFGIELYEQDGTFLVRHRDNGTSGAAMSVFHCGLEPTDRVAWILENAGATAQDLMQVTPGGGNQMLLTLPAIDAVSLAAADGDLPGGGGDRDDELVIGNEHNWAPLLMENRHPTTPIFAHLYSQYVNPIPVLDAPAPGNAATPLYRDLDGDEFPDVLAVVQSPPQFVVAEGVGNRHPDESEDAILMARAASISDAAMGQLALKLDFDHEQSSATHLQVVVWHQDELDDPLDLLADSNYLYDLGAIPTGTPEGYLYPEIDIEDGDACGDLRVHWVEVRLVEASVSGGVGKITKGGTSYVCAVVFDETTKLAIIESEAAGDLCIRHPSTMSCAVLCENPDDDPDFAPAVLTTRRIRAAPSAPEALPDPGPALSAGEWYTGSFFSF